MIGNERFLKILSSEKENDNKMFFFLNKFQISTLF